MKTKTYVAMLVILASGIIIGFHLGQYWAERCVRQMMSKGPEHLEQMMVRRLSEKLSLTEHQIPPVRERVRLLTEGLERSFQEHRKIVDDRVVGLLQDIRPFLNPEQQHVLDRMGADDLRPGPPLPHDKGPRMPPPGGRRPFDGSPSNAPGQIEPDAPPPPFENNEMRPIHGKWRGDAMSAPEPDFNEGKR
jgi:hypothetical protein